MTIMIKPATKITWEKDKIGHEDTFKMSALFFFLLKYHNWSLAHPFIDFFNALIVLSAFPYNAGAFQGQRMFLALNSISWSKSSIFSKPGIIADRCFFYTGMCIGCITCNSYRIKYYNTTYTIFSSDKTLKNRGILWYFQETPGDNRNLWQLRKTFELRLFVQILKKSNLLQFKCVCWNALGEG